MKALKNCGGRERSLTPRIMLQLIYGSVLETMGQLGNRYTSIFEDIFEDMRSKKATSKAFGSVAGVFLIMSRR
jgi:hypothetical protein